MISKLRFYIHTKINQEKLFSKQYEKHFFQIFKHYTTVNTKVIKFFIKESITDSKICRLNEMGHTIIHLAFYNVLMLEWIEQLFEHCIKTPFDIIDIYGVSHLHIACIMGNLKKVDQLLHHHADLELPYKNRHHYDCNNFKPLHLAIANYRFEVAECLLQHKADVQSQDDLGRTPLHLAASMFPNGHIFIGHEDIWTNDPLTCLNLEDADVLRFMRLLHEYGSDINALDENGESPLFHIFHKTKLHTSDFWCSPFFDEERKEVWSRQKQKLQFLLDHGADVRIRNSKGNTVLHSAIKYIKNLNNTCEMINTIFASLIEVLLDAGADVNAEDNDGLTALQGAVNYLSADVVSVLLKHNADLSNLKIKKFDYYCNCLEGYSSINFRPTNKWLLRYETAENLFRILNLLTSRGFVLDSAEKLEVMRFLTVKINSDWNEKELSEALQNIKCNSIQRQIINIIQYGSAAMLRWLFSENTNLYDYASNFQFKVNSNLHRFDTDNVTFEFYKNMTKITGWLSVSSLEMEEDIKALKSIELKNGKSFYDIFRMNPNNIYVYAKSNECKEILMAEDFDKKFNCADLIKGHIAKCLIRRIFLNLAVEFLEPTLGMSLPYELAEKICSCMSNEELWFMCSNEKLFYDV